MAARSIKTIFRDFWYIIFAELSSRYSKLHWDSIVENVEKMSGEYGILSMERYSIFQEMAPLKRIWKIKKIRQFKINGTSISN
jgi:hypothetical protein